MDLGLREMALVKIVRLEKGQSPPLGRKVLIVHVGGPRSAASVTDGPKQMTMRVPVQDYQQLLADLVEKMKGQTDGVIFVRGAPG